LEKTACKEQRSLAKGFRPAAWHVFQRGETACDPFGGQALLSDAKQKDSSSNVLQLRHSAAGFVRGGWEKPSRRLDTFPLLGV
jgi:hypothetical protein